MDTRYTDAENTGAPIVPHVEDETDLTTERGTSREELEEIVLSHRLEE